MYIRPCPDRLGKDVLLVGGFYWVAIMFVLQWTELCPNVSKFLLIEGLYVLVCFCFQKRGRDALLLAKDKGKGWDIKLLEIIIQYVFI